MSAAVPFATLIILAFLIMEIIGIATDFWMVVEISAGIIFNFKPHAGIFKICYNVFGQETCFWYIQWADEMLETIMFHYLGIVGSSLLGTLLLFIATIIGLCGCSKPNPKSTVQNIAGVGIAGGFFCGVGALWFYIYFIRQLINDLDTIFAVLGVGVEPGFSLYLCAAAGGGSLLVSIALMIIGCNMEPSGGAVLPSQQPNTVVAVSGQAQNHPPPTVIAMQNAAYNDPFAPTKSNF